MRLGTAVLATAARLSRGPTCSVVVGSEHCAPMFLSIRRHQPSATITSKAVRGEVIKPPPFPYRTKRYNSLRAWFDKTSYRMDGNSKIIVVDGPPTAGKSAVAKGMAEGLDFLYVPAATLDMIYVNEYGGDMKKMDPILPPQVRSYTLDDFNLNPKDKRLARMQLFMYEIRYNQYVDALAHVFNTGQGVVLDRCVYSDKVYTEAALKNGYLSKGFRYGYGELSHTTLRELKKPHVVVYLDLPVGEVEKRLKHQKVPALRNSKAMTRKYLEDLEHFYKLKYLKEMEENCHLLVYDWTDARGIGDVEGIIEDLERLEFEKHERDEQDPKMKDWYFPVEDEWCEARWKYTSHKHILMSYFRMDAAWLDCPEVYIHPDHALAWFDAWEKVPGGTYEKGFNAEQGDTGLLFKMPKKIRDVGSYYHEREWWIPEK